MGTIRASDPNHSDSASLSVQQQDKERGTPSCSPTKEKKKNNITKDYNIVTEFSKWRVISRTPRENRLTDSSIGSLPEPAAPGASRRGGKRLLPSFREMEVVHLTEQPDGDPGETTAAPLHPPQCPGAFTVPWNKRFRGFFFKTEKRGGGGGGDARDAETSRRHTRDAPDAA